MSVQTQSASTAYATKSNIVYPGTTARAALVADLGETRINDDPSRLVSGAALTVLVDQEAGTGTSQPQVALPIA